MIDNNNDNSKITTTSYSIMVTHPMMIERERRDEVVETDINCSTPTQEDFRSSTRKLEKNAETD